MNFCFSSKKDSISDLFWSERIDNQWFNLDKDIIIKYLKYSSIQKFYNKLSTSFCYNAVIKTL